METSVPDVNTETGGSLWPFVGTTAALFFGLAFASAYMKRDEIQANWSKYRDHPLYMLTAFLFKPDEDPRSRLKFTTDNFVDVIHGLLNNVFSVFLQPVFKIFQLITEALTQSLSGIFNIRALLANMWNKWNAMTDVFTRRFNSVFHQMRVTFTKLFSSFEKTLGAAAGSIYTGLSTIHTMMSFMDLMIKVIIIILISLVVLVIFFFFVLFPLIPLILMALGIISASVFAAEAGGLADTFCFHGSTRVQTDQGPRPISKIEIGDRLITGATVTGVMEFDVNAFDMYVLHGVQVSGTHIVYGEDGVPQHVRDHPAATKIAPQSVAVYCLITSDRKIPVLSDIGPMLFADWEEITDEKSQHEWHKQVCETLNASRAPETYIAPLEHALDSEAVFSGKTRVWTNIGPAEIRGIRPGQYVTGRDSVPTRVTGIVRVRASEVKAAVQISAQSWASAGCWIEDPSGGRWSQPKGATTTTAANAMLYTDMLQQDEPVWYTLFTESGTFRIVTDDEPSVAVRDFSDVGSERIHETYDWVLKSLQTMADENLNEQ